MSFLLLRENDWGEFVSVFSISARVRIVPYRSLPSIVVVTLSKIDVIRTERTKKEVDRVPMSRRVVDRRERKEIEGGLVRFD